MRKELEGVEREIEIIEKNAKAVEKSLEYFRGVTKEEVKAGMDYWKAEAEGLKIGSEAWEKAFNSYISYKSDYEKITSLEKNPSALFLHKEDKWREQEQLKVQADYEQGLITYRDYRKKMLEVDRDYYKLAMTNSWISTKEAKEYGKQIEYITKKLAQMNEIDTKQQKRDDWNERVAQVKENYRVEQEELTKSYENEEITQRAFEEQKFRNEIEYLYSLKAIYRENSYDRHRIENEIQRKEQRHQQKLAEEYLDLKKRIEDSYFTERSEITKTSNEEEYKIAHETLLKIVEERKQMLGQEFALGKIDEREYKKQMEQLLEGQAQTEDFIQRKYEQNGKRLTKDYYKEWFGTMRNAMGEEIEGMGKQLGDWTQTAASALSALQQSVSQFVATELEIQTKAIEKRYDKEISLAEGNSYQVAKLEKEKQRELAKAKAEAQRKTFALQVLSTLATTASNAIAAYGAALQIGGLAGLILAPIAAATAVAAGMIQVATIKKQQEAAEASYRLGGFTKSGAPDEVAGIVHAGEWVAPRELVTNPQTAPVISALEQVRRGAKATNTLGDTKAIVERETLVLEAQNVRTERQIEAMRVAQEQQVTELRMRVEELNVERIAMAKMMTDMSATMKRLNKRLDEPFVTVNTVTGEHGMQKAQSEYERLMRNKSPKDRR